MPVKRSHDPRVVSLTVVLWSACSGQMSTGVELTSPVESPDAAGIGDGDGDGNHGDGDGDGDGNDGSDASGPDHPDSSDGGTEPTLDGAVPDDPPDADKPVDLTPQSWPGGGETTPADEESTFGENLSGLTLQSASGNGPEILWAVQNGPSMLFRLERGENGVWTASADDWESGKQLFFPDGQGSPDAEGVTRAEPGSSAVYVSSERDNDGDESHLSILRFETSGANAALAATHEWDLTADLPEVDSNAGLEAITWVPDAHLTVRHFRDEARGEAYDPAHYPGHGTGLFFVGLEANGVIYAYALDHESEKFTRIATIESGHEQVMELAFDRETGTLWAHCDDGCSNRTNVLTIASGGFAMRAVIDAPSGLEELNNEGLAISDCHGSEKLILWADDGETDGHALREGTLPCTLPF